MRNGSQGDGSSSGEVGRSSYWRCDGVIAMGKLSRDGVLVAVSKLSRDGVLVVMSKLSRKGVVVAVSSDLTHWHVVALSDRNGDGVAMLGHRSRSGVVSVSCVVGQRSRVGLVIRLRQIGVACLAQLRSDGVVGVAQLGRDGVVGLGQMRRYGVVGLIDGSSVGGRCGVGGVDAGTGVANVLLAVAAAGEG